jgi:hypothetical protein
MWAGAAFELRLAVEFCVYILTGEVASLAPGAVRCVQLQARQAVDDLVLEFEGSATWAVQAKAGPSLRFEWNPKRPFGKAQRQLYAGATGGQSDPSAESLDRLEPAADHRDPASITAFGAWLEKALNASREALHVFRTLGVKADLALSLGTATLACQEMAEAAEDPQQQIHWLYHGLENNEEALRSFRDTGAVVHLIQALGDGVANHLVLAQRCRGLDTRHVLALCREGEALCTSMGDSRRLAFPQDVWRQWERGGQA